MRLVKAAGMGPNVIKSVQGVTLERTVKISVHHAKMVTSATASMESAHTATPAGSETAARFAVLTAHTEKTVRKTAVTALTETVISPQESVCATQDSTGHTAT